MVHLQSVEMTRTHIKMSDQLWTLPEKRIVVLCTKSLVHGTATTAKIDRIITAIVAMLSLHECKHSQTHTNS